MGVPWCRACDVNNDTVVLCAMHRAAPALLAALRSLLYPDTNPAVADVQRDNARALLVTIDGAA